MWEIAIGVGVGLLAGLLIRHLDKAEREARKDDLKMVLHLIDKDNKGKTL